MDPETKNDDDNDENFIPWSASRHTAARLPRPLYLFVNVAHFCTWFLWNLVTWISRVRNGPASYIDRVLNHYEEKKTPVFRPVIRAQNICTQLHIYFEGRLNGKRSGGKPSRRLGDDMLTGLEWRCHIARQRQGTRRAGRKWCMDRRPLNLCRNEAASKHGHERREWHCREEPVWEIRTLYYVLSS